jgi:hypothetical protein
MSTENIVDQPLRRQLIATLKGGNAFDRVEEILAEIPSGRRFEVPDGLERSPWQVIDHMRRTLEDLISYSENWNGDYKELDWPKGYWPGSPDPGDSGAWDKSVQGFFAALSQLEKMVEDRDLFAPFPWAADHTFLREVLLAIEHTAYHSGELVQLARALKKE